MGRSGFGFARRFRAMRMFGMWVGRVVVVIVVMIVVVVMVVRLGFEAAHASAECIAKRAIGDVGAGGGGTLAFDMVVVGVLDCADLGFETEHLRAVFAKHASGGGRISEGGMGALVGRDVAVFAIVKGQHLFAVGADAAIGGRVCAHLFSHPFGKGF